MSHTSSFHLERGTDIKVHAYTYDRGDTPALGVVRLDDTLTIVGKDPAHLVLLAEALSDAARRLSDELDKAAARVLNTAVPA